MDEGIPQTCQRLNIAVIEQLLALQSIQLGREMLFCDCVFHIILVNIYIQAVTTIEASGENCFENCSQLKAEG